MIGNWNPKCINYHISFGGGRCLSIRSTSTSISEGAFNIGGGGGGGTRKEILHFCPWRLSKRLRSPQSVSWRYSVNSQNLKGIHSLASFNPFTCQLADQRDIILKLGSHQNCCSKGYRAVKSLNAFPRAGLREILFSRRPPPPPPPLLDRAGSVIVIAVGCGFGLFLRAEVEERPAARRAGRILRWRRRAALP